MTGTPPPDDRSRHQSVLVAPAVTILLSSFLLFLVQPILAKQILPWYGGSAGVWTICMLFFQLVLLLGYGYAHWLTHHAGARQYFIHIGALLASCLVLPIFPNPSWRHADGSAPELQILGLLAATVGLPYFLLSSTAPLLQKWLSDTARHPGEGRSIYRLFALSNLGSLAGLLSYPFAIEPFASVRMQVWTWSAAYAVFALCCAGCAWHRQRVRGAGSSAAPTQPGTVDAAPPPGLRTYAYWVACSALGSALLLAGTNHLTQNIASIPLLWILPLSLYLASFTLCFEGRSGKGWYERRYWLTPAMLASGAMAWALFADRGTLTLYAALPVFIGGLFLGCMLCHGELARSKPNPVHLTRFYLSVSVGGAVGGLLIGLAAPQCFNGYWEMPIALIALAALGLYCCWMETAGDRPRSWLLDLIAATIATLIILLLLGAVIYTSSDWSKIVQGDAAWGCAALLLLSCAVAQQYGRWRAVPMTAVLCTIALGWASYQNVTGNVVLAVRNFYGTLTVSKPDEWHVRWLRHGVILHGSQAEAPPQSLEPTTYYGRSSGIGRAITAEQRIHGALYIGAVGLGTGTLATYGRVGDRIRIYELNPQVIDIARTRFTYLADSRARVETVLGDARLSLESELARGEHTAPEQRFDVLALDAFSGDAIPVHLLTRQAFAIYARATRPDGVIAFHVSNRYLDLTPVIEHSANEAGYGAVLVTDKPQGRGLVLPSHWVLVTKDADLLRQPEIAQHYSVLPRRGDVPPWTDDFTSLFHILK